MPTMRQKASRDCYITIATSMLVCILAVDVLRHVSRVAKTLSYDRFPCDFCLFYSSDLALRSGQNPYTANLVAIEKKLGTESGIPQATEPPTQLLFFEPFTWMSVPVGYWTWTVVNTLA